MSITKSNCALCSRIDVLYKFNSTAHIQNAFASVNNNLFQKESIDKIQLCIICAYRVELSSEIMRKFEEICGRNNTGANRNCSFCEDKTGRLIDINENPNDVQNKISVFLNSAKTKYDIKDLKSCLKCLYNLSIWFEVRTDVFNIMKISDSRTGENSKIKASNANVVDGSPKASGRTLRKSARNSTQNELENSTVKIDLTKNNVDTEEMQTPKRGRRTRKQKINNNTTKMSWYKYLNLKLKNLQTVDKIIEQENITVNLPETETDKNKLFRFLPFVEIFVSSQISEDRILENESTEIPITVNDAENETPIRRGGRRKIFTQKKATPKARRTKSRATMKIKFSFPMKPKSLSKYSPTVAANLEKENSPVSEEIIDVIDGESDSVNNFVCDTCDKNFNGKCEFLVHRLKHEKKDNVVVNVLRQNLPQTLNILQLSPEKELNKATVSPEVINRLLTKWIGAHAAKTYLETDNVSDKRNDNEKELETELNEGRETLAGDNKDEECEKSKDEVESKDNDSFDKEVNETTAVDVIDGSKDSERQDDDEETNERDKEDQDIDTESCNKIDVNKNNTDLSVVCDKQDEHIDQNDEIETKDIQEKKDAELEASDKDALVPEANTTDLIGVSDNEVVEYVKENTSNKESDEEEECNSEDKCEDETSRGKTDTEQSGDGDGAGMEDVEDTSVDSQLRIKSDEEVCSKKINEDKIPEVRDACEGDVNSKNDQCTSNLDKDEIENCKNGDTTRPDKVVENVNNPPLSNDENDKNENFDDFSNSDLVPSSVMTCEDLLSILETNIDSELDPNHDTSLTEAMKRKRDPESEEEPTPKRKRVRFADEKEIFSPDKSGVLLEKIIADDHILTEDELNEKES